MVIGGNLTLGSVHTVQYTDDIELYTRNLYDFINQGTIWLISLHVRSVAYFD